MKIARRITILMLVLVVTMMLSAVNVSAMDSLKGKTVLIEGDSIQESYGKFLEKACNYLDAKKIVNHANGGSTIGERIDGSDNNVYHRFMKIDKSKLKNYDYIFIAAGTNDYGHCKKHGLVKLGGKNNQSSKTTSGALNLMIDRIQKNAPKTKIVIVTPIHKYAAWKDGSTKMVKGDCNKHKNDFGLTLFDYREGMEKVADKQNVYLIKGNHLSTKDEMSDKKYTEDYTHPKDDYAKTLAKRVEKEIKKIP